MSVLVVGLLGIAVSVATELVTWLNKKLTGTVLQGKGAFILTLFVSLIGAFAKEYTQGVLSFTDLHALWLSFGEIFAISQVYFVLVAQTLGLQVS